MTPALLSQDRFGIQITCMQEDEPLGTAGPIALAHERGLLGDSEPFFVINCDVACDFNLRSLYTLHKEQRARPGPATLARGPNAAPAPHPPRRRTASWAPSW